MSFAIVAGSVIAAGASLAAGRASAKAGERAANASNAESDRQFDLVRQDTAQQRQLGQGATGILGRLYGIPIQSQQQMELQEDRLIGDTMVPGDARLVSTDGGRNRYYDVYLGDRKIGSVSPGGPNGRFTPAAGVDLHQIKRERQLQASGTAQQSAAPDMSDFFESPDFQFNLQQGQQAIDRSLAARGRSLSGAGVKEGQRFASGLASQEFGNFTNRLMQMAGLGSAATGQSASAGFQHAGNVGQNNAMGANARASGYQTAAMGVNNAVQGGISNMLLQRYLAPGA